MITQRNRHILADVSVEYGAVDVFLALQIDTVAAALSVAAVCARRRTGDVLNLVVVNDEPLQKRAGVPGRPAKPSGHYADGTAMQTIRVRNTVVRDGNPDAE